jgi:diguanylate cyclase (GGDEF)-like protein
VPRRGPTTTSIDTREAEDSSPDAAIDDSGPRAFHAPVWHVLLVAPSTPRRGQLEEALQAGGEYLVTAKACPALAQEWLAGVAVDTVVVDLTAPNSPGTGDGRSALQATLDLRDAARPAPLVLLVPGGEAALTEGAAKAGMSTVRVDDPDHVDLVERDLRLGLERLRLRQMLEDTNARLETEIRTDPLTTALNRRGLQEVLEHEIERCCRSHGEVMALLLDLDDFKRVNDRHGLSVGDRVLVEVVERIRSTLRRTDHLSRVGGDEFVVLLPDTRPGEARMLAEKVRLAIAASPFRARGESVRVTASLGLVGVREASIESILSLGHPILTLSKRAGKDRVSAAGGDGPRLMHEPLADVIRALDRPGAMRVRAAPVVGVRDGAIVGHELFVRSSLPGFESPRDFFRVAAEARVLSRIDLHCLRACCEARACVPRGRQIHLNVNPATLVEVPASELLDILAPEADREVVLDLSEAQIVGEPAYLEPAIAELRQAGVRIALDDGEWGSGCLETLILIRPEILKLRPRLLRDANGEGERMHRLRRLMALGRRLGSTVLCEGVETAAELDLLRTLGIDLAEGPYWPMRELTSG